MTPNECFSTWAKRYKSFRTRHWPVALSQTAREMSNAGFFYTGYGDKVQCFHCGIVISGWYPEEKPREEHARYSSHCPWGSDDGGASGGGGGGASTTEQMCIICWQRKYDTVFVPCGHATACTTCASNVNGVCPICQRKISQVLRLYLT